MILWDLRLTRHFGFGSHSINCSQQQVPRPLKSAVNVFSRSSSENVSFYSFQVLSCPGNNKIPVSSSTSLRSKTPFGMFTTENYKVRQILECMIHVCAVKTSNMFNPEGVYFLM